MSDRINIGYCVRGEVRYLIFFNDVVPPNLIKEEFKKSFMHLPNIVLILSIHSCIQKR